MLVNAPIQPHVEINTQSGLPSVELSRLSEVTRIDNNMGESFLVEKIRHAMDVINRQIMDVPLPLNIAQERFYVRAVLFEAGALISEENADFDTTSNGQDRAEMVSNKAQRLRRLVNHCIADLTGRTRNRVRLI
jgi:hypothetical protein